MREMFGDLVCQPVSYHIIKTVCTTSDCALLISGSTCSYKSICISCWYVWQVILEAFFRECSRIYSQQDMGTRKKSTPSENSDVPMTDV